MHGMQRWRGRVGAVAVAVALGGLAPGPTATAQADVTAAQDPGWTALSTDGAHTCGIRRSVAWCWGDDLRGQLGDGTHVSRTVPVRVVGPADWTAIDVGSEFTCGLRADTSLWCWGENGNGRLGVGDSRTESPVPVQVGTQAGWAQLAVGRQSACAIRTDGTLWCWGLNGYFRLGLGDGEDRAVPTQLARRDVTWRSVAVEARMACALDTQGATWCWGEDGGNLGVGLGRGFRVWPTRQDGPEFTQVDVGEDHGCGVTATTQLWCWGYNYIGELGLGDVFPRRVPFRVDGEGWLAVSAGGRSTCATRDDGRLYCFGRNWDGGLGTGDLRRRLVPTAVRDFRVGALLSTGRSQTCATRADGVPFCWGDNVVGGLGDGTTTDRLRPTRVLAPV